MTKTNYEKSREREELMALLVKSVIDTLQDKKFYRTKPFSGAEVIPQPGIRYAGVGVRCRFENARLHKEVMSGTNAADMVPWLEGGIKPTPSVFLYGDRLMFTVKWPDVLQSELLLSDLPWKSMYHGERFFAGIDEHEKPIVLQYDNTTPHFRWVGMTGSGKTSAMMLAAIQVLRGADTMGVVMDAKNLTGHEDWKFLDGHPSLLLPVADTEKKIEQACAMLLEQLELRMKDPVLRKVKIVVFFDELQQIVRAKNQFVLEALQKLGIAGREAGIHLNIGTHYPSVDEVGGAAFKVAFGLTICFKTLDENHTRLALGENTTVKASELTMRGDSYIYHPDWPLPKRVQWAFIPEEERRAFSLQFLQGERKLAQLDYPAEAVEQDESNGPGRPREPFKPHIIAAALRALERFDAENPDEIARDPFNAAVKEITGRCGVGSSSVKDLIEFVWEVREMLGEYRSVPVRPPTDF